MPKNRNDKIGRLDRLVRTVLAAILLGFALFCPFARSLGPVTVWLAGIVGAVLLITAIAGRCPLYGIIGSRT